MILSLLIPTLNRRKKYLDRLSQILKPQHNRYEKEVEVLLCNDDGERSIGEKRNTLLENAKGDYIAFIDDDDIVSPDYIDLVMRALEKKPDVVGMHLLMTIDGVLTGLTYHSLQYKQWSEEQSGLRNIKLYYRNPNHLNPVKREHALATKFPGINMGEDKSYSDKLLPSLKTEEYIIKPIYIYEVRTRKEV